MNWTVQLNNAIAFLGTGPGVMAASLIAVLFLSSFTQPGRWLGLCLLLTASTFSCGAERVNALMTPLSQIRNFAEVLTVLFLGVLILPALFVRRAQLRTGLLAASIAFWVLEVFYAIRVGGGVEIGKAGASVIIYTALLLILAHGMAHWLRDVRDVYSAVRCLAIAGMIFVGCTTLQLVVNPSAIVRGGRLFAVTANPQYAAMVLAICLIPVAFLVASPRENWTMRLAWGATAGLTTVLLIWTGSRTGVLMALVGVGVLFRARIGLFLGMGLIVAIFVFAFLSLLHVSSESTSRVFSTLDTRSTGWSAQFENFKRSPLIGRVTDTDWGTVENSYLTIASHCGLLGLGMLAVAMCLIGAALRRLGQIRAAVASAEVRMLADVLAAGILGIFAGAFFEGILVGTLTFMVLALYFYLGLLKFLVDEKTAAILCDDAMQLAESSDGNGPTDDADDRYGPVYDPLPENNPGFGRGAAYPYK